MRSLFDATKNPLFNLICTLVNEINAGAKLTRNDIRRRIYSLPNFHYNEAPDTAREENIIDTVFKFPPPDNFAKICINAPVPPLINDTELSWLKTMLTDDETAFILPPNLRAKLLKRLEHVPPLYDLNIRRKLRFTKTSAGKTYHQTLATLVDALSNRRKITCQDATLIPYRLEYDLYTDNYSLIIWNEITNAVNKIPIERLNDIKIAAETIPLDVDENVRNFYSQHTVEVSMLLRNTRNAVERCFALFSSYNKHSRLQADDTYFLSINYYDFEEAEVIDKILSLGAAVTVLTPANLRDKIIQRFKAIKALYAD